MDGLVYLSGTDPQQPGPLARYLPPVLEGAAGAFLAQHVEPGGWVLDPFGVSPATAVEMARAGYRLLVAVNNPVTRFLLEMTAQPPSQADLRAALSDLAAAHKGEERLETHLQSLYLTECTHCRQQVPAEAFIWERQSGALVGRIYQCACGESGEFPATEADQANAARLAATDGLHRARALERVAAPHDPDRRHVEEALECYLPRAVYALITIVNKLDSLPLTPAHRRALLALVLSACDEANALWPHPSERPRPRQLALPPRFLEKNVWRALERGVDLWAAGGEPVSVANWPPAEDGTSNAESGISNGSGSLHLFDGPARDLVPRLKDLSPAAVVTVLPRPNQAFWTLSALWTGWLWGQAAAASFKSVLRRRRYDWNWHAAALYAALKNLSGRLPLNAPLFAILPEPEPAFLSAALLAAAGSGFDLGGLALRTRQDPAQAVWRRRAFSHENKEQPEINAASVYLAIRSYLQERSEPAPYLALHAAGLAAMAADGSLGWRAEALTQLHAPILAALEKPDLVHQGESRNPETGLWALAEWDAADPLSDRVEIAAVRFLQKNPACRPADLEKALNADFPGLLTPSQGLARAVLDSYALQADGGWTLRPEDAPSARRADLEAAAGSLAALAARLDYTVHSETGPRRMVAWLENGETVYSFCLLASAVAGRTLRQAPPLPGKRVLVLPGGRAGLLAYKLERDPSLRTLAEGWRIVKFRALRRLAEIPDLTRARFEEGLVSDPIEPPEQMKLF